MPPKKTKKIEDAASYAPRSRAENFVVGSIPSADAIAQVARYAGMAAHPAVRDAYDKVERHRQARLQRVPDMTWFAALMETVAGRVERKHKGDSIAVNIENATADSRANLSVEQRDQCKNMIARFRAQALREKKEAAPLVPSSILDEIFNTVRDVCCRDTLAMMRACGLRVSDLELWGRNFSKKKGLYCFKPIEMKNAKTSNLQYLWQESIDFLSPEGVAVFEKCLAATDSCIFYRAKKGKKNEPKANELITTAYVDAVIDAAVQECMLKTDKPKERFGSQKITSYSFRIEYITRTIERYTTEDGIVNWASVKQKTRHLEDKALRSTYQRLGYSVNEADLQSL